MKLIIFLHQALLILPLTLTAQPKHLTPGSWGGDLHTESQSTEFYLDIRLNGEEELTGFLYLPVTNFHEMELGVIQQENSMFTAGPIQFSLTDNGKSITGTFHRNPRELTFQLSEIAAPPAAKEPIENNSTAEPVWTFSTNGAIWGAATADDHNVYIGSSDGNLYALSQTSGELQWTFQTGGAIFSRPMRNGRYLYILSDDGNLHKLETDSGKEIWRFDTGGGEWQRTLPDDETPGYDTMASAVTFSDGFLFAGSADHHLYAIDESTGDERWRFKTEGPIQSVPVVDDGMVYFGSYDHHVYAVDVSNGELKWKFDTGQVVLSSPVIAGGNVIIGSRSADLFALNTSDGSLSWSNFFWFSWVESSGTLFDGRLYIGSSDLQRVNAFDPENGNLLWAAEVGGSPWSKPAVTKSAVYAGTFGNADYMIEHRGGFFALDRQTGEENWRFMMEKPADSTIYGVVSSPAVANGMVFFGGLDGVIYGFNQ